MTTEQQRKRLESKRAEQVQAREEAAAIAQRSITRFLEGLIRQYLPKLVKAAWDYLGNFFVKLLRPRPAR